MGTKPKKPKRYIQTTVRLRAWIDKVESSTVADIPVQTWSDDLQEICASCGELVGDVGRVCSCSPAALQAAV